MKNALIVIVAFLLAGCSGQVKQFLDNAEYATTPDDENAKGIRVYMPALMMVTSRTMTYTDPDKKVTTNDCTPVESAKIEARPDYSRPLRVRFDHGPFDTFTFGVTLNADGILMAVNTQNTPPVSSIAPLLTALTPILGLAAPKDLSAPTPKCTGNPEVVRVERCVSRGTVICEVTR